MILVLDNYDSFTYNLVQYLLQCGKEIETYRNDELSIEEIALKNPSGILISPGPCTPDKAGVSEELILHLSEQVPIFGVCLGMQAIGEAFGGKIVRAKKIMHGKSSQISHDGKGVFADLPNPFSAIRYHSLVVQKESLPEVLEVTATSEDGEIMGLRHKSLPIEGVQFHPESILSENGLQLVSNWVKSLPCETS